VDKAPEAFRTISEVADELDVPQHVLRFWESRFREIKPMKRGGGRRYYRPDDVGLLRGIHHLLYGEGYTIRGVQRILKEQGVKFVQSVWQPGAPQLTQRVADDASAAEGHARRPRAIVRSAEERAEHENAAPAERREPSAPSPRIAPPPVAPAGGLAKGEVRKLQDVLQQLIDCRAQLDAALAESPLIEAGQS
jgi:DNA-binding transcriptional MerR regulator